MNMENNGFHQQASPSTDPRVEKLAIELEKIWAHYQSAKKAADQIAQRPNTPEELIRTLKDSAAKRMEERVSLLVKTFMDSTPAPGFDYSTGHTGTQQTPPRVKKLCRTEYDKMLSGVCGGIAEYLHLDSSIVRLFFVITTFVYLIGLIAYIVLAVLLPVKMSPDE